MRLRKGAKNLFSSKQIQASRELLMLHIKNIAI